MILQRLNAHQLCVFYTEENQNDSPKIKRAPSGARLIICHNIFYTFFRFRRGMGH